MVQTLGSLERSPNALLREKPVQSWRQHMKGLSLSNNPNSKCYRLCLKLAECLRMNLNLRSTEDYVISLITPLLLVRNIPMLS